MITFSGFNMIMRRNRRSATVRAMRSFLLSITTCLKKRPTKPVKTTKSGMLSTGAKNTTLNG